MNNKETLEAAREYYKRGQLGFEKAADTEMAFLKGARWQQDKKLYSEEEVYDIVQKAIEENSSKQLHFFDGGYSNPIYNNLKKWFEKHKKK